MPKKLREGWREAIDKESGDVYYYNKVTKETTWTFPEAEEEPEENQEEEEEKKDLLKPIKLADKAYRKQMSTEGKKMLLKTLSVVEDKKIDIEAQQEPIVEEDVDFIESDDEDDETASLSSKVTMVTSPSTGAKVVRRRRHSLQQLSDSRTVSEVFPTHWCVADEYMVPRSAEKFDKKPFTDLLFLRGAGTKSPATELGLYCASDAIPKYCVLRAKKNATKLGFLSTSFNVMGGEEKSKPIAVIRQATVKKGLTTGLYYLERVSESAKPEVIYTFTRKLRSGKVRIFEGKSTKQELQRFVLYFGEDRICFKNRDFTNTFGFNAGSTVVDWRPTDNSTARVSGGVDLFMVFAALVLCDFFHGAYASLAPSKETREEVKHAESELQRNNITVADMLKY